MKTPGNSFKRQFLAGRILELIVLDPDDPGGGSGGGDPLPGSLPGLAQYLRNRYTSNLAITEEIQLLDLLYDVIFVSSRHFMSQGSNGKIRLHNKKPVDFAFATDELGIGDDTLPVDNVKPWISDQGGFLLVDPYTTESEIAVVSDANYDTAQNSITLTQTGSLFTIGGFSGCDGDSTPATATLVAGSPSASTTYAVQLDGIEIAFTTSAGDTDVTVASFLAGAIRSDPRLNRRFSVEWDGAHTVTITALFGNLVTEDGMLLNHVVPETDPSTAPTLSGAGSGTLAAGDYKVAYTFKNVRGQTLLSPYKNITLAANKKITVSTVSPPAGCTVVWYVVCEANSLKLRYHSENDGSGFDITSLPLLSASLPPDFNRTGTEVMRVKAVFSDRELDRTGRTGSNVIRASYEWLLGTTEKSINRIDFKFRDSSQDYRLIELRLRDDVHIAKTKKISNQVVNGQAVDSYFQAYRNCSSFLAELRDGDFFYKWAATREALLLEEGDVVACTDDSSGVINLPVRLETIDMDLSNAGLPKNSYMARKFTNQMYDDSPNDIFLPIVIEP